MNRFATLTALTAATTLAAGSAFAGSQAERVEANETTFLSWTANHTGEATVAIDGDGDTDLDLFVFDDSGNRLAFDISLDDNELVRFQAVEGMTYEIEVQNLGDVWNAFDLQIQMVSDTVYDRADADGMNIYAYAAPDAPSSMALTLHGDGDTDLDLQIFDGNGELVAEALSMDDHEYLLINTEPNEQYEIIVTNHGDVYNDFSLDLDD